MQHSEWLFLELSFFCNHFERFAENFHVRLTYLYAYQTKLSFSQAETHERCSRVSFRVRVFNTTFNYITVISWRSVLLLEETKVVPGENHQPAASH